MAAVALPFAVASAGPVGDAGRMVARMSGLTDGKARAADDGARAADGAGGLRVGDPRVGEPRLGEPRLGQEGRGEVLRGEGTHGEDTSASSWSHLSLGGALPTTTRCGPDLSTPDGVEAQTCVLARSEETWARTYYRNATGRQLSSALSLMAPDGRSVRMHCLVGAQDEPGVCETPRERTRGDLEAYTAVAEFASSDGQGPLLLRSGSNSPQ